MTVSLGAGYYLYQNPHHQILLSGQFDKTAAEDITPGLGMEYLFYRILSVRAGHLFNDQNKGLSFGLGARYPVGFSTLSADFSYTPADLDEKLFGINLAWYFDSEIEEQSGKSYDIEEQQEDVVIYFNNKQKDIFQGGSDQITGQGYELLDFTIELAEDVDYQKIIIEHLAIETNHTDTKDTLPQKRSQIIRNYFIKKNLQGSRVYYLEKELLTRDSIIRIKIVKWNKKNKEKFNYHYYNGMDLYIKEVYDKCLEHWQKALALDPDNSELKTRIREVENRLNSSGK